MIKMKKLSFTRETLRELTEVDTRAIAGGFGDTTFCSCVVSGNLSCQTYDGSTCNWTTRSGDTCCTVVSDA